MSPRTVIPGKATLFLALLLVVLVAQLDSARSANYDVGGSSGWTFNVAGWTDGKSFQAGDVLVFNYDPAIHDVVAVDQGGYDGCKTNAGAKVYTSGKDSITLAKGQNYFICNFPGHCEAGLKIAVTAT